MMRLFSKRIPTALLSILIILPGCGSGVSQFKHLKFLVGEWESIDFHRTCTLLSKTEQNIHWDEVIQWSGQVAVSGARNVQLFPHVILKYQKDGQPQLTIGDPEGDHLLIDSPERAVLRIKDHYYVGPLAWESGKDWSITIPKTPLYKGHEVTVVEGTLKVPVLELKSNEPLHIDVTPNEAFSHLPRFSALDFHSNGTVDLKSKDSKTVSANWGLDGVHLRIQKSNWKRKAVLLRAKRTEKRRMKLTEETEIPGSAINLKGENLQIRCLQTQMFKAV